MKNLKIHSCRSANQGLFALFTVASFFYRWFVLLSILYFLNKVFEPYGLKVIGQMIALMSIWGLFFMPLKKVYDFCKVPGSLGKVKKVRMYVTLLLLAGFISGLLLIPFPASVFCPFELRPRDAASVYVEVEGILSELLVKPGQAVEEGQLLARLENIDLEIEVTRLRGEQSAALAQLDSLKHMQFRDEQASLQMDLSRERYESVTEQLEKKLADMERLELRAPATGIIIPPPKQRESTVDERLQLASWSGSPLDKKNLGATFQPDGQTDLFCQIGDPDKWDAVLVLDQRDLDWVHGGEEVKLMFQESSYHVFVSKIQRIATDELEGVSQQLASTSGGPVPAQADPDGVVRPLDTSYQADVPLDDSLGLMRNGLIGQARIKTKPRTLASRFYRYLSRTFSFDL